MKRLEELLPAILVFIILISFIPAIAHAGPQTQTQTQTQNADYYVGRWETVVETDDADVKLTLDFARKDGVLGGTITLNDGTPTPGRVTESSNGNLFFEFKSPSTSFDVEIYIRPRAGDTITGSIMSMYDFVALRAKK